MSNTTRPCHLCGGDGSLAYDRTRRPCAVCNGRGWLD